MLRHNANAKLLLIRKFLIFGSKMKDDNKITAKISDAEENDPILRIPCADPKDEIKGITIHSRIGKKSLRSIAPNFLILLGYEIHKIIIFVDSNISSAVESFQIDNVVLLVCKI